MTVSHMTHMYKKANIFYYMKFSFKHSYCTLKITFLEEEKTDYLRTYFSQILCSMQARSCACKKILWNTTILFARLYMQ